MPMARRFGLTLDGWLCLGLASLAFGLAFVLGVMAPARLFAPETLLFWSDAGNGWFQSDVLRVFGDMAEWDGDHKRARVHPIFSLVTIPVVVLLQMLLGVDARVAVALYSGATAAGTVALLYLTLRRLHRSRFESALLCLLACVSAGWLFFYTVPESFQLGGLTIALALYLAAAPVASSRWREALRVTLVSAATLSITVTNWMFGWLVAVTRLRPLQAAAATVAALALIVALAWVQSRLMPTTAMFTGGTSENSFILKEDAGGPLLISKVFWLDTVVAPQAEQVGPNPHWRGLSFQRSAPGSGSLLGWPAVGLWAALLVLGAIGLARSRSVPKGFKLVLVGGLLGQWGLHLIYGEETFLYALHFLPLLVVLASFAFEWRDRRGVLRGALIALLAFSGFNNAQVLNAAKAHAEQLGSERTELIDEMARRPLGPWPRGEAHLLLGVPGAPLASKAYFEAGGSFSPWIGSFGVSLWAVDSAGAVRATSDQIPLNDTHQQVGLREGRLPFVTFTTPLYVGRWEQFDDGAWQLDVEPAGDLPVTQSLQVLVRGVGPAAGPVRRIEWQEASRTLTIDGRWRALLPAAARVQLGDEHADGFSAPRNAGSVHSAAGWAYARVTLAARSSISFEPVARATAAKPVAAVSEPRVDLPDTVFVHSLRAQIHHLAMSVEGREARPGDPLNYGDAWLRDSAYVVAALAHAGNLALAREMALDLAQRDFFGGFGSEADGPGMSLWALHEVASRLRDAGFDRAVWPDVQRKAQWIVACLDTDRALLAEPQGPFLGRFAMTQERKLACLPSEGDLIAGRMDWHVPRMYLTAFSYRGLTDAAAFATRLGHHAQAAQWTQAAQRLQAAWNDQMTHARALPTRDDALAWLRAVAAEQGFYGARNAAKLWTGSRKAGGEMDNPRTYISAVWPTQVARGAKQSFAERLFKQPVPGPVDGKPLPMWTYFDVALAHQSLYLGNAGRAWETLERYWRHPATPGAYTWWEGNGEENSSYGWHSVRGWVAPKHVTPHYWTAAEVLALQLDMLTMLDETEAGPEVVIGAGVRPEWLKSPIGAEGIHVRGGRVDWRWDGSRVEVVLTGQRHPVRLGPAFPAGTTVTVRHTAS